jgi:nickel/cobalt transporter (NicO) family protein
VIARAALIALVLVLVGGAASADAHPLGNFSINHLSTVSISADRVDVRYVLDQAEIPTLQERSLSRSDLLAKKRGEVLRGLQLRVDGTPRALRVTGPPQLAFRTGVGGLRTSRFTFRLAAGVVTPSRLVLEDETFPGRVGWKAIVSAPGRGTAVRTSAPSGDPTNGLRRYPQDLLTSPLDRREAGFSVRPGSGTLEAPRSEGGEFTETHSSGDGFASVFERAASGEGVLVLLLLTAFAWGAIHALSPGHGKAMVAAYLVGTRGRATHAVALGATVTVAHTIGVFALGLVTLALSQYVLPEDLYPWLNVVSGLLVVTIGASVLRSRIRWARARGHAHEHHHHRHSHESHHSHDHSHSHADVHMVTKRSLIGLGAAAGMIPCPSALVVLLAAVSQHEIGLGLLLILAFSLGLAGTLTGLGLVVVCARRLVPQVSPPRAGGAARLATALPAVSAVAIVGVGCVLTANALPVLM